LHPELAHWAELLERLRWAAFLLDDQQRLVWASKDLQRFVGSPPEDELGYGLHIFDAFRLDSWRQVATQHSQTRLQADLGPVLIGDALARGIDLDAMPDQLRPLFDQLEPEPFTDPIASSFDYLEPGGDPALPLYRVNVLATPLRDKEGAFTGTLVLGFMSVRPGLMALLARGDEDMYERMAKLVEPSSREAAILFCDLEGSTELSRTLPTGEYFRLIRSLWTEIDALVANNEGIVGKHAGDGASAFFLVDDLGSASRAASAAVRTAREIHERSERIFGDMLGSSCLMRVGIHWGSSLYIGQLVPGGRLDVTALGDAVNECARIQEAAPPDQTLASKELIERLSDDDAAALGMDPGKLRYEPLAKMPDASEKAIAGAGTVAVIPLGGHGPTP
jgi:class 3 adenylate cyclase